MSEKKKHTNQYSDSMQEALEMLSGSYIAWKKSKDQVWSEMEKKLETQSSVETKVIFYPWMKLAVAAVIVLLIGIPVFMQLYTKTIHVPSGKHSHIVLPDDSEISLNAQSTASYKPLMWKFSRKIKFEGEAYFTVQPGKKFNVISDNGSTLVLGTRFNIYARDSDYQVTCISGQVKVMENINNKDVILHKGQKAVLNMAGILAIQTNINTEQTLSWLNNKFSFTSVSLSKVFKEIGRQYGVIITFPEEIKNNSYTGTFNKSPSVDYVLNLVCKPFGLNFIRKSENEYIIVSTH